MTGAKFTKKRKAKRSGSVSRQAATGAKKKGKDVRKNFNHHSEF
jgi:hypothetical protein